MDRLRVGGAREERAARREGQTVDGDGAGETAPQLIEASSVGGGEDADDGALLGGRGHAAAARGDGQRGQGGVVGGDQTIAGLKWEND